MKQELEIILRNLNEQLQVLAFLDRATRTEENGSSRLTKNIKKRIPEGIERNLIRQGLLFCRQREEGFRELISRLDDLRNDVRISPSPTCRDLLIHEHGTFTRLRLAKTSKTQHRSSSLLSLPAFIPLTTVASILGMNTADIRDMPQKQWIF